MAYKLKQAKKVFYLADIKKKIYDDRHKFDTFKSAIRVNIAGACSDEEKYYSVVPLEEKEIKRLKFKKENII